MTTVELNAFVQRAEQMYASRLQSILEPEHVDEFIAIQPESGDYFLGKTLSKAAQAARRAYPERLTHTMRIGHKAALHFGVHLG